MPHQISLKEINELSAYFNIEINPIKKDTILYVKPECEEFCYVLSGMVYLCTENANANRHIIQLFRPGTFFITSALPYVNNGISYFYVKYDSKIVKFKKESLPKLLSLKPDASALLFENSIHDLLELGFAVRQNSLHDKILLYFQKESQLQNSTDLTLPIPFSDLAEHLGVDRSALMKELKHMRESGEISGKGHHIHLSANSY